MQLSKNEEKAYETLRGHNLFVFQIKDLCLLLNLARVDAYNLIKALKYKRVIKKQGAFYSFFDTDDFVIAVNIHFPSYISLWTALNYYGWSDQLPKKIYLCTTKYAPPLNHFSFITLSPKRFFGYTSLNGIVIAEKEKAIIDSLFFPKYAGGIAEIDACLRKALPQLDKEKLITYALQMKSKAVLRRMGYLLEKLGVKEQILKKIKRHIGHGYELLDPTLPRKNLNNLKWLLDVNI